MLQSKGEGYSIPENVGTVGQEATLLDKKMSESSSFPVYREPSIHINVDVETSAVYMKFRDEEIRRTVKSDAILLVDLDKHGNIVGVEILLGDEKIV